MKKIQSLDKKYHLGERVFHLPPEDVEYTAKKYVGMMIAERRIIMKYSQGELSKLLDISQQSLNLIEKGRQYVPFHILEKLCDIFDCHSSDLLPF